jgi:hypothetical protein
MTKSFPVVLVVSCVWLGVSAQTTQEPQKLEPGRPVERRGRLAPVLHTHLVRCGFLMLYPTIQIESPAPDV